MKRAMHGARDAWSTRCMHGAGFNRATRARVEIDSRDSTKPDAATTLYILMSLSANSWQQAVRQQKGGGRINSRPRFVQLECITSASLRQIDRDNETGTGM